MVGDQKSSDSTPAKEEEKVKIEKIFLLLLLCLGRPAVTSSDERKKYRCPIYDADVHELSALCSNVKERGSHTSAESCGLRKNCIREYAPYTMC